MIGVVFGTTGELIKLAPVLTALERVGHRPLLLTTGQQVQQIPSALADFGLPQPDFWLGRGHHGADLEHVANIPGWATTVVRRFARHRGRIAERLVVDGRRPLLVVHGDTMTSVLGGTMGRALRVPVGHIEAGMRSGTVRNPFPEEINRRLTAKLARLHFAPNPTAANNLRRERVKGVIVDTGANTIVDSLRLAVSRADAGIDVPDEPFGIVSLHRFELIERPSLFADVLELLRAASRRFPLLFVDHSTTAGALQKARLDGVFDDRFRRIPRLPYAQFIALLRRSSFVVTDSGGSQEECAYLGLPCLIHRAVSEHQTGLGGPIVLSQMDRTVLRSFLEDPLGHATPPAFPAVSPTHIILERLAAYGHIGQGVVESLGDGADPLGASAQHYA